MVWKPYYELLRDPRWQRKRLEVMERDGFACRICDSEDSTLNVDHGYYEKGKMPWEYPDDSLRTVCERCHKVIGRFRLILNKSIASFDFDEMRALFVAIEKIRPTSKREREVAKNG